MRNIQYYQRLESEDLARSDPFDGAIPAPGIIPQALQESTEISKINLQTTRFTSFNTYVSCFFGIEPHQIDASGHIALSLSVADELRKFGCEDAIIIDLNCFAKRLEKIVETEQPTLNFGHVTYLSDQNYNVESSNLMQGILTSQPMEFLKRDIFAKQQEFRISCKQNDILYQKLCSLCPPNFAVSISPEMAKQIGDSHIIIDIGSIREFSKLIKLTDLLEGKIAIRELN